MTAAPTKATCPYVNRWTDNFNDRDKGKSLVNFQIFALMHEIAHSYIYATIRSRVDIYEINHCVKLGAQYARGNPRSYDYYVGSTLGFLRVLLTIGRLVDNVSDQLQMRLIPERCQRPRTSQCRGSATE